MNKMYILIIIITFAAGFMAGFVLKNHHIIRMFTGTNKAEKAQTPIQYTIDNCVTVYSPDRVIQGDHRTAFWYTSKDLTGNLNLKLSEVEPMQASHAAHTHAEAEIFYILSGQAECSLNGEHKVLNEQSSFYCPPGSLHGIRNVGETPLQYLVIKNN